MNPALRAFATTAAFSIVAAIALIGLILMLGCEQARQGGVTRKDPPPNLAEGVRCAMSGTCTQNR